ncbi:MAG: 5-formyltetrahydrofolate cyclo-ligase [Runella slithyformis]|nr:MAG: 5-formyltetrahydrofolate cyclo-ligase [Runella slithyformis]TAH08411.1 MAG: 5-formyltetrahydrofolate cyclo-ligase [Runella slithyformis]
MTKAELRPIFKQKRQTLTAAQVADGSLAIVRLFFSFFEVEKMKAVHCYLPIRRQNEVDTFPIIYTIQDKYLQTQVVVPRMLPLTNDLEHYQWLPDMTLTLNKWGLLEPNPDKNTKLAQIANINLVVVPLLACDKQGQRVGYGKGYYDKFLANCRPNVLKVGVSFFEPVALISDSSDFDVRLDYCITPQRVWRF